MGQRTPGGPRHHTAAGALALVIAFVLALPASASAHLRSGTVAVDYRASVIAGETAAYRARIYLSDRALALTIRPGHRVVLLGYLGEPVFRLDSRGLAINRASPTAAAIGLLAAVAGSPHTGWALSPGRSTVVWHDARVQGLPLHVARGTRTVPLLVDGRAADLRALLARLPPPPLLPWICALMAVPLVLLGGAWLAHRRALLGWAVAAAIAAGPAVVLTAFAFAVDAYGSPGSWLIALNELVLAVAALLTMLHSGRQLAAGAAAGLGVLASAGGLFYGPVFFHPLVLAVLPGQVIRVCEILAIGGGLSAAVLGGMLLVHAQGTAAAVELELGRYGVTRAERAERARR